MGIEPTSSAWKADILADVLYPQLQKELYHNFPQMSSMNLAAAKLGRHNKKHCTFLCSAFLSGGDYRDRTGDLLHAMQALSQLS